MLIPQGPQKFKGRSPSVFQVSTGSTKQLPHSIIYIINETCTFLEYLCLAFPQNGLGIQNS